VSRSDARLLSRFFPSVQKLPTTPHTADDDDDFEARLATLRKKSKPGGEAAKAEGEFFLCEGRRIGAAASQPPPTRTHGHTHHPIHHPKQKSTAPSAATPAPIRSAPADYTDETLHYESGPHPGDAAVNVALGATLVWLPLTLAAIGRAAFVRYRFTDRRLSVMTTAPWKQEQLDADYRDIKDVKTVGRGVGLWGDMVVTLTSGDKVELRSLPQFTELRDYVLARRDALGGTRSVAAAKAERLEKAAAAKGFGQ
jgi:nitrogen fixation protein